MRNKQGRHVPLRGKNPCGGEGEQQGKDGQRVMGLGLVPAKQAQSSAAVWGRQEGERISPPPRAGLVQIGGGDLG